MQYLRYRENLGIFRCRNKTVFQMVSSISLAGLFIEPLDNANSLYFLFGFYQKTKRFCSSNMNICFLQSSLNPQEKGWGSVGIRSEKGWGSVRNRSEKGWGSVRIQERNDHPN